MAEREPRPLIKFKLLSQEARLPAYAHQGDAGFDLSTTEEKSLDPGERYAFKTGLSSEFPQGFYVEIRDRSGHAHNHGLHVLGGTVDAGFRGQWQVILINHGDKPYKVEQGERIAQGVLLPVAQAEIGETEKLSPTKRGAGGIGSTGKR